MEEQVKTKLKAVIQNNFSTPLLIDGVNFSESDSAVILPSTIDSKDLGIIANEDGYIYPKWLSSLQEKASLKKRVYLVIDSINNISPDEQLKFYEILKYRAISSVKIPDNVQILLTTNGKEEINAIISSLTISYKVENK